MLTACGVFGVAFVQVAVTDMGGLATTASVELYLSNANVAPVVAGGVCSVQENAPEGTFLTSVVLSDLNPLDSIVGTVEASLFKSLPKYPPQLSSPFGSLCAKRSMCGERLCVSFHR